MSGGRLQLLLLCGAVVALGAIAVSLLPGTPPTWSLRIGIAILLATPWLGVAYLGGRALAKGAWRRAVLALLLLVLAAGTLL